MQAFDRHVHLLAGVEEFVIEFRQRRASQHGIAEISGGDVLEVAVALLAHGVRRFLEQEELVFEGRRHEEAHVLRALQNALEEAARADRLGGRRQLAEEERQVLLEGNEARGLRHHPHRRIRIGRVPARVFHVVVELVVAVPAHDHVAEAEPLLERRKKLRAVHVFAAEDAVDVGDAELHIGNVPALDEPPRLGLTADADRFLGFHLVPPDSNRWNYSVIAALARPEKAGHRRRAGRR